ncbi:MAG: hypothetical protein J3K34DRAFT_205815 [Monoraphidium minutum]|nr:MAG: hypothetical protein J3K34DRAFT_205815 [Monoraphidium minutum]
MLSTRAQASRLLLRRPRVSQRAAATLVVSARARSPGAALAAASPCCCGAAAPVAGRAGACLSSPAPAFLGAAATGSRSLAARRRSVAAAAFGLGPGAGAAASGAAAAVPWWQALLNSLAFWPWWTLLGAVVAGVLVGLAVSKIATETLRKEFDPAKTSLENRELREKVEELQQLMVKLEPLAYKGMGLRFTKGINKAVILGMVDQMLANKDVNIWWLPDQVERIVYFNVMTLMLQVLDEVVDGMSINFAGVSGRG